MVANETKNRNIATKMNGGVPAALYCFVLLYISAGGAGPWSLDAMRVKNHNANEKIKVVE